MVETSSKQLKLEETSVYPEHEAGYRLFGAILAITVMTLFLLTAMTIRDKILAQQFHKMMQVVYQFSAQHGLQIDDIIVEGNRRTSYEELVQALNLSDNESILGVDIAHLQQQIEQLTWVRRCVVKRSFFPNNILVNIEERKVKAIWQYEGRFYPVDAEGNVIEVEDYEPDAPILFLAGEGAPHHLEELLAVLSQDDELNARVKGAVFVSERRWNLILDHPNGIILKLPEQNFAEAYQKIALLSKRNGIFKRKLTSVDLRYDNKIVLELDDSVENLMLKQ